MTPEEPYVTLFLNKPNYLAAFNRQNNVKSTELKTLNRPNQQPLIGRIKNLKSAELTTLNRPN